MPNSTFQNFFRTAVSAALGKHRAAQTIDHHGLRGHVRELFTRELLEPILPPGAGVIRGKVTDSRGGLSAECDLIVFSRQVLPPLLFDDSTGLSPIEAGIYAIEVKSTLTATELDDTIEKFRRLMRLRPLLKDAGPVPVLFAFESDLTVGGKSELDRYLERDDAARTQPLIRAICVPGRGYWYFDPKKVRWTEFPPTETHQEVVDFLGGLANTIPLRVAERKGVPFGRYVIDEGRSNDCGTPERSHNKTVDTDA